MKDLRYLRTLVILHAVLIFVALPCFPVQLHLFALAESLGAVESLAESPSIMTHASVPPEQRAILGIDDTLIRLSVGIESCRDLIADLDGALNAALESLRG